MKTENKSTGKVELLNIDLIDEINVLRLDVNYYTNILREVKECVEGIDSVLECSIPEREKLEKMQERIASFYMRSGVWLREFDLG